MNKTRVRHIDLNHSWLQVPLHDIVELGLRDGECLDYARVAGDDLYLCEDEGMAEYLEAAEAAGWTITLIERHYADLCDYIRNLPLIDDSAENGVFSRIFGPREA